MILTYFFIILIFIILTYLFLLYISIVKKSNTVKESFSTIDVYLKKRYDLIPNLLIIANKFMEHERELFTRLTQLRADAIKIPDSIQNINQKMLIDKEITTLLKQLQVSVENYPQLKSDKIIIKTMQELSKTEEYIAAARRYYNASAKDFNNAVEIFPSSVIAHILGYKKVSFIKAEKHERKEINNSNKLF